MALPATVSLGWLSDERVTIYGESIDKVMAQPSSETQSIRSLIESLYGESTPAEGFAGAIRPELGKFVRMRWMVRGAVLRFYPARPGLPKFEVAASGRTSELRAMVESLYAHASAAEELTS